MQDKLHFPFGAALNNEAEDRPALAPRAFSDKYPRTGAPLVPKGLADVVSQLLIGDLIVDLPAYRGLRGQIAGISIGSQFCLPGLTP